MFNIQRNNYLNNYIIKDVCILGQLSLPNKLYNIELNNNYLNIIKRFRISIFIFIDF